MDADWAKVWVDLLEFFVIGAVAIYAHVQGRGRVSEEKMAAEVQRVDESLKTHGSDIAGIKEAIRQAPTHGDIEGLGRRIGELHGDIQKVDGRLEGIGRAVDLINQHLLSGK